jgi:hypothetical protein
MALAAAWTVNRLLLHLLGKRTVLLASWVEEILKTGLALLLGGAPLFAHLAFGLGEASIEAVRGDYTPAALDLVLHGAAGLLTAMILPRSGAITVITLTGLLHTGWNAAILKLTD